MCTYHVHMHVYRYPEKYLVSLFPNGRANDSTNDPRKIDTASFFSFDYPFVCILTYTRERDLRDRRRISCM